MNQNSKRIAEQFYLSFGRLDSEGMNELYHTTATFYDPAFGPLEYQQTTKMWRMLCHNANDFSLSFEVLSCEAEIVKVKWIAKYVFSKTKRPVTNTVYTTLVISEGLIQKHTDEFDLWNWSKQALGLTGWLIGWSPYFKSKLQKSTNKLLQKFGK